MLDSIRKRLSPTWRPVQGVVVAAAFSLLLVGTNLMNPLLPLYRELLGFDALMLSLTYVCYVVVLTVFFVVMARPSLTRWAAWSVLAALVLAVVGDALLWTGTGWGLLAGRAVSGVSGGLGTGAASALVVVAMGERGRAISATGNLVGAVIGASAAQLAVIAWGGRAPQLLFTAHAGCCLVLLIVLGIVLVVRRAPNRQALRSTSTDESDGGRTDGGGAAWIPLVCGAVAWVSLSISVVFVPSLFDDLGFGWASAMAVAGVLFCSAVVQVTARPLDRVAPWLSGIELLAAGMVFTIAAILTQAEWSAVVGVVFTGFGIGVAYRTGLVSLTRGATPSRQGALASLYGAVSYGSAAVVTLAAGVTGRVVGLAPTVLGTLAVLVIVAVALVRVAPRSRPTPPRRGRSADHSADPVPSAPVPSGSDWFGVSDAGGGATDQRRPLTHGDVDPAGPSHLHPLGDDERVTCRDRTP